MEVSPIAESPIARALLRTLLFAASIEAIFFRLLTIPPASEARPWVAGLHESTGRAGEMMAWVALVVLLPSLLSVAYAALRSPAWPGSANSIASIGILSLVALWISGALIPRGPFLALAFGALALGVDLAMLAGMYESRRDAAGRSFAVALAGSLLCMTVHNLSDPALPVSFPAPWPSMRAGLLDAGLWLFFVAGALAFAAFSPSRKGPAGALSRAATLGLSAASAFALIFGAVTQAPALGRLARALGAAGDSPMPVVLRSGTAAAALFLVVLTGFRGLGRSDLRSRGYGVLFLLLAGYPHRYDYEHLLAVLGVALVSASPPPARSPLIGVRFEESRPRDV